MPSASLPRPLCGIIPPLATPLVEPDRLDLPGLERLVEHVLAGGVHGLFLLGTTGEGPGLSYRLRCELIERTCEQVAGRVPVLVGISDTSLVEALQLAEHSAESGAQGVVSTPPYYVPIGQGELIDYMEDLADQSPLPLYLYNMPGFTRISFELDTVARLMQHDRIVGIKDSSGLLVYFHRLLQLCARRPDFSVLIGPEELLGEAVLLGAHGGVCGGANLAPHLYVALYDAARQGDLVQLRRLHAQVMRLSTHLYTLAGHTAMAYLRGLKAALVGLGLCEGALAAPLRPFGPAEQQRVQNVLQELGLVAVAAN